MHALHMQKAAIRDMHHCCMHTSSMLIVHGLLACMVEIVAAIVPQACMCESDSVAAMYANRKGKRSALVDHHMKNKQHRSLMAEMDKQLRKVTIVSGMAQRLTNKVAIVTGGTALCSGPARRP